MLNLLFKLNEFLNNLVWGAPALILLLGTGVYLTIKLNFFQFVHPILTWKKSFGHYFKFKQEKNSGVLSSFQAVSSAMAATLGVGNIAGVSTALSLGGPGAIFWMWISALVGMATKFSEAALGVKFRERQDKNDFCGGVMYYIKNGMGRKWNSLALLYSFLAGIAALGIGNMVQSNTLAQAAKNGFNIPYNISGLLIVFMVGTIVLGGIKRIGRVVEKLVPLMALFYFTGGIIILLLNIQLIPQVLKNIIKLAFKPAPAWGGFVGCTVQQSIRFGISRGIFSNEAGLGAASIVHAQARNTPVQQGMWGMWEVFIDTIIVGTITALVILTTGALETGATGVTLAAIAFNKGLPGLGSYIINISIIIFAYTTMLTWSFYGEESWRYIFGKYIIFPYRLLFIILLYIGAIGALEPIWLLADTLNGLMALPNLIALIALAKILVQEKNNYLSRL